MAFLNEQGLATLWNKINDKFVRNDEIDNLNLITIADIDEICGATIQVATLNEVTF